MRNPLTMLKNFVAHVFNGKKDCFQKVDAAVARSAAARARAAQICETLEVGSAARSSVNWGPSFEAVARAQAEHPAVDVSLPAAVDDEPAPDPEEARVRREVLGYHDDQPEPPEAP